MAKLLNDLTIFGLRPRWLLLCSLSWAVVMSHNNFLPPMQGFMNMMQQQNLAGNGNGFQFKPFPPLGSQQQTECNANSYQNCLSNNQAYNCKHLQQCPKRIFPFDFAGGKQAETTDVYDVCIVGGGMFGSAAAKYASAIPGVKVCLVGAAEPTPEERPHRDIFSSHYDEGRMVDDLDTDPVWHTIAKLSTSRYRQIEEMSGIKFYYPVGNIFWARADGIFLRNVTALNQQQGIPLLHFCDQASLQNRFPFLRLYAGECALFEGSGAGYVRARWMVKAQKKIAEMQGCKVIESIVTKVNTLNDGLHEIITQSKGSVKAKRIIFATGAFFNMKSVDTVKKVDLTRTKETAALMEISVEEATRLRTMPTMFRMKELHSHAPVSMGLYILPPIQYPDGKFYLKFGRFDLQPPPDDLQSLEQMKMWYLSEGNTSMLNTHLNYFLEILPGVKINRIHLYPCALAFSPTWRPYIDHISPTVTVALAGNGRGVKLADEIGRIAAHLSVTGKWTSEVPQELFRLQFK